MLIPEGERFSRVYRGRGELTDHLLVSHALVGTASAVTTGEWTSPRSRTTPPGGRERRDPITGQSWRPSTSDRGRLSDDRPFHLSVMTRGG